MVLDYLVNIIEGYGTSYAETKNYLVQLSDGIINNCHDVWYTKRSLVVIGEFNEIR